MSTILITGANKGLGLEVVARLIVTQPDATILLGSRSVQNGEKALADLSKRGLSTSRVHVLPLDVTDQASLDAAAQHIREKYDGKLNVVYNNAGVFARDPSGARPTFDVNYYGVKRSITTFDPLLVPDGKNVIVSSGTGCWATDAIPPSDLKDQLQDPSTLPKGVASVDEWVERYIAAANDPSSADLKKFPDPSGFLGTYPMSKAFVNAYIRALAPTHNAVLSLVCPGYCATELNGNSGPRKASTGARSIVLASEVARQDTGKIWRDGKAVPFDEHMMTMEEMTQEAKELEAMLEKEQDPMFVPG